MLILLWKMLLAGMGTIFKKKQLLKAKWRKKYFLVISGNTNCISADFVFIPRARLKFLRYLILVPSHAWRMETSERTRLLFCRDQVTLCLIEPYKGPLSGSIFLFYQVSCLPDKFCVFSLEFKLILCWPSIYITGRFNIPLSQ